MTIQQFIKLNFEEKAELICNEGNLIDSYIDGRIDIKVFSVFDFFTEVVSDTEAKEITDIIPYTRGFGFFSKQKELLNSRVAQLNNLFLI